MQKQNKLVIAAAGAGKTTFLANEALTTHGPVLITTFTRANEDEIKRKLLTLNDGIIPSRITIQTWFSFLLQHGVRPYQGTFNADLFDRKIKDLMFVQETSGFYKTSSGEKRYYGENEFKRFYFTKDFKIYSDKLAKFVFESNKKCNGEIINRLEGIYSSIFIDEVQDFAGYDLEILSLLFKSKSNILLVGDPRQVTYTTHHAKKHPGYRDGKIKEFIAEKCKKDKCTIDETSLAFSHRNNLLICRFSSKLYPLLSPSKPCSCITCRGYLIEHEGIFLIKENQISLYRKKYSPIILHHQNAIAPDWNFGKSKGLGFDRVLIYPTAPIIEYLKTGKLEKIVKGTSKAAFDIPKFYVALTRARFSVAIVYNYSDNETFIKDVQKFEFALTPAH